jgi:tetratricopeptide (TPR) repeat protein
MTYAKSLSSMFLMTLSASGLANNVSTSYDEQEIQVQSRASEPSFVVDDRQPDTTGLWFHISQGQMLLAQQEFTRLSEVYPNWSPEADLLEALAALSNPIAVPDEPSTPPPVAETQPDVFTILSQQNEQHWPNVPDILVEQASELAYAENNVAHHSLLGWVYLSRRAYSKAIDHFNQVKRLDPEQSSADDGINKAVTDQVKRSIDERYAAVLDDLIVQYPEFPITAMIETAAWAYFQQQNYQAALYWFEYLGDYSAQVISLDKAGDRTAAVTLACQHTNDIDLLNYCVGYYSEKQALFFERELYRESILMAEKIQNYAEFSRGQLELYAWSHYHVGNKIESQQAFTRLTGIDPENATYAEILVGLHTIGSEPLHHLQVLYPRVAEEVQRVQTLTAQQRKQFDRVRFLDVAATSQPSASVDAGIAYRTQASDDALADLDSTNFYVGFSDYYEQSKYGIRVNYKVLDGDTPISGDWVGENQLIAQYAGDTLVKETGLALYIKRQFEGMNTLLALEYATPDEGVSSSLGGTLSAVWFWDDMVLAGSVFRQRVEDSYLSDTGLVDGDWGAVEETGIRGLVSYEFQPDWAISSEIEVAWLEGHQVEDNTKIALALGLTYDWAQRYPTTLDYLRAGPYVRWMSYGENQNDFTIGNGGYFSPENYLNLGGRAELLTVENNQWQVKSMVELSYHSLDAGSIHRLRYTDSDFFVAQSRDSGFGANMELEGQWLMTMNWALAARLRQSFSESYRQTELGIQVRWYLDGKSNLTSDELISSSPYAADYAWY